MLRGLQTSGAIQKSLHAFVAPCTTRRAVAAWGTLYAALSLKNISAFMGSCAGLYRFAKSCIQRRGAICGRAQAPYAALLLLGAPGGLLKGPPGGPPGRPLVPAFSLIAMPPAAPNRNK